MPEFGEGSAGQSYLFLSGHPRPVDWIVIDGRSPGLRISVVSSAFPRDSSQWQGHRPIRDGQSLATPEMIDNPLTVAGAATVSVPTG